MNFRSFTALFALVFLFSSASSVSFDNDIGLGLSLKKFQLNYDEKIVEKENDEAQIRVFPYFVTLGEPWNASVQTQEINITTLKDGTAGLSLIFPTALKEYKLEALSSSGKEEEAWVELDVVHAEEDGNHIYSVEDLTFFAEKTSMFRFSFLPSSPTVGGKYDIELWTTSPLGAKNEVLKLDPWFNYSFSYARPLYVQRASGSESDAVINISINTASLIAAGKMQGDCDDGVFTLSDNTTILNFSINSGCNTSNTIYWVRFPVLNTTNQTFFFWYGSSSASSYANESNTFAPFHLAFTAEEASGTARDRGRNNFTVVQSNFTYGNSTPYHGYYYSSDGTTRIGLDNSPVAPGNYSTVNYSECFSLKVTNPDSINRIIRASNQWSSPLYQYRYSPDPAPANQLIIYWAGYDANSNFPIADDVWRRICVLHNCQTQTIQAFADNQSILYAGSRACGDHDEDPLTIGFPDWPPLLGFYGLLDDWFIRTYDGAPPAPASYAVALGPEVEGGYNVVISSPSNTTYYFVPPILNFTAYSINTTTIPCNYSLDAGANTSVNVTNSSPFTAALGTLSHGQHNVSVTCYFSDIDAYKKENVFFTLNHGLTATYYDELNASPITANLSITNSTGASLNLPASLNHTIFFGNSSLPSGLLRLIASNTSYFSRTIADVCSVSSVSSCILSFYLLPTSADYILIQIIVVNSGGSPVENAVVEINKTIGGSSRLVSSQRTDSTGSASFVLNVLDSYIVRITHPSYTPFQTSFYADSTPKTFMLGATSGNFSLNFSENDFYGVARQFLPSSTLIFSNTTLSLNISLYANTTLTYSGWFVYLNDSILLNSSNSSSPTGSFQSFFFNPANQTGFIRVTAFWRLEGRNHVNETRTYSIFSPSLDWNATLERAFESARTAGLSGSALGLTAVVFSSLIAGALFWRGGAGWGVAGALAGFGLFSVLNFLDWKIFLLAAFAGLALLLWRRGGG